MWSLGATSDDKILPTTVHFEGQEIVVTEKMDGENTTLYSDYYHARSIDGQHHPSRDWVKGFWGTIRHNIPERWRVCGENMFAVHSIRYSDLETYFLGFSVWNDDNVCLSWDKTTEWMELIGVTSVPVLYRGIYDEKILKSLWNEAKQNSQEGYVIRLTGDICYKDFGKSFGKFVRPFHVTSDEHWMHKAIERNGLKGP